MKINLKAKALVVPLLSLPKKKKRTKPTFDHGAEDNTLGQGLSVLWQKTYMAPQLFGG